MRKNLVAFTEFDDNFYGVDAQSIEDNDLYAIDLQGINFFKKNYKGNKPFKVILIDSPESVCHMRMIERGDSHIAIAKRLANDKEAFKDANDIADYIVENDFFDSCVKDVYDYIMKCENETDGDNT
jgi:guanylate kinase